MIHGLMQDEKRVRGNIERDADQQNRFAVLQNSQSWQEEKRRGERGSMLFTVSLSFSWNRGACSQMLPLLILRLKDVSPVLH